MNINHIRMANDHELEQVKKYDYVVVGDSAERAREIKYLLGLLENALVPVARGERCHLSEALRDYVLADDGHVYQYESGGWNSLSCPFQFLLPDGDPFIQPVRLVRVRDMEGRT